MTIGGAGRLFAVLLIGGLPSTLGAAPPAYEGRRWQLVFEDEFSGTALDMTRWSYHYPWSRTHNHSAYSRVENISVRDGKLVPAVAAFLEISGYAMHLDASPVVSLPSGQIDGSREVPAVEQEALAA